MTRLLASPLPLAALTYVGIGVAAGCVARHRPTVRRWQAAARGAWWAAFAVAAAELMLRAGPQVDLAAALGAGAWTFAWALAMGQKRHRVALGTLLVAGALGAREATPLAGALVALASGGAMALGLAVARAMEARKHLAFRVVTHWVSFAGTFAVLGPWAVREFGHPEALPLAWRHAPLALLLASVGAALAVASTQAFAEAGGTPEPLDHPERLAAHGIYARVRHPIQLAEILLVSTGAVLMDSPRVDLWAVCFALALVGPVRGWEEQRLRERFGSAFDAYRDRVPAYLPRRSRPLRAGSQRV